VRNLRRSWGFPGGTLACGRFGARLWRRRRAAARGRFGTRGMRGCGFGGGGGCAGVGVAVAEVVRESRRDARGDGGRAGVGVAVAEVVRRDARGTGGPRACGSGGRWVGSGGSLHSLLNS
jgi:hypothetical protein